MSAACCRSPSRPAVLSLSARATGAAIADRLCGSGHATATGVLAEALDEIEAAVIEANAGRLREAILAARIIVAVLRQADCRGD